VIDQLNSKSHQDFGGDAWKFVEQADSLGIKDISSPAKRPSVQEALNELKQIIGFISGHYCPTSSCKNAT
jgi:hypothetical protein